MLLAFVGAFTWIAAWIGLSLKEPEAVQSAGFVWLFPLAFASSLFVLPATMPSWLQGFAERNPLSIVANTARTLTVGGYPCGRSLASVDMCQAAGSDVTTSLIWAAGIVAVFVPLTAHGWRRLD